MYVFEGKSKKRDYSHIINNVTQLITSTNDKRQLNPAKVLSSEKIQAIKEFVEMFKERR